MGRYTPDIISDEQYELMINTILHGYKHNSSFHRPNRRAATILQLLYNTGANISEIVYMTEDSFEKVEGIWLFRPANASNRCYVISPSVKHFIDSYISYVHCQNKIDFKHDTPIFGGISEAAIWKVVRTACEYLELTNVSPNSIKKRAIERIFEISGHDEEIITEFMQQESSMSDKILSSIDGKERNRNKIFE